MTDIELREIENKLQYCFSDKSLLSQAFTHSSYANIAKTHDNERMEFLGDAILQLAVSEYLYDKYDSCAVGALSTMRSNIVSADGLRPVVEELDIIKYLQVSSGANPIKTVSKKIAANLFEAIVGAIYLDGGIDEARAFLTRLLAKHLESFSFSAHKDSKTLLQEYCQKNKLAPPIYKLAERSGLDNEPTYKYELYVNGKLVAFGTGSSKKAAEQDAANKIVVEWRIESAIS